MRPRELAGQHWNTRLVRISSDYEIKTLKDQSALRNYVTMPTTSIYQRVKSVTNMKYSEVVELHQIGIMDEDDLR